MAKRRKSKVIVRGRNGRFLPLTSRAIKTATVTVNGRKVSGKRKLAVLKRIRATRAEPKVKRKVQKAVKKRSTKKKPSRAVPKSQLRPQFSKFLRNLNTLGDDEEGHIVAVVEVHWAGYIPNKGESETEVNDVVGVTRLTYLTLGSMTGKEARNLSIKQIETFFETSDQRTKGRLISVVALNVRQGE